MMYKRRHYGFTLLEVLVAIAILTVLASVAVYNVKAGNKISEAETLVLRQALVSYIPEQIKLYYLTRDHAAWSDRVKQIQNEMLNWPLLQNTPRTATVYKDNGIELVFNTVYREKDKNDELRDILIQSPMVEVATARGYRNQQFTIKYKLN